MGCPGIALGLMAQRGCLQGVARGHQHRSFGAQGFVGFGSHGIAVLRMSSCPQVACRHFGLIGLVE